MVAFFSYYFKKNIKKHKRDADNEKTCSRQDSGRDVLCSVDSVVRIADKNKRLKLFLEKLLEESSELEATPNLEECADVFEVLLAIAKELGISLNAIKQAAAKKYAEKGGFDKGYVLRFP